MKKNDTPEMRDFIPAANRPHVGETHGAPPSVARLISRREFELQLTLQIAPSLTDYYLKISDRFTKRQFADHPGITPEAMLNYQDGIATRIRDEICTHSHAIVTAMSAALFTDAQNSATERQPKAAVTAHPVL